MTDPSVDWANYRVPRGSVRCPSLSLDIEVHRKEAAHSGGRVPPPYPVRCILAVGHTGVHESWMYEWDDAHGTIVPLAPTGGLTGR